MIEEAAVITEMAFFMPSPIDFFTLILYNGVVKNIKKQRVSYV